MESNSGASSDSYLRSIFDEMFEGIQILDFEYRYLYLNRTASAHGRRARDELIGRRIVDMYPGIDQTEMFGLIRECMVERKPRKMVNHFTYPDGPSAWFDLRMSPVPMGTLILSVDISEQKSIESQLQQSRQDLSITLDCMTEGVITTDIEGRVTRMNPAAQVLIGWSEEEGRGRDLADLMGFLDQETEAPVDHVVRRALRDGMKIGLANHTLLVARDGARIPIASSGAPIKDDNGEIRGVVLVLRNMKEEYDLAAMLQQAQKLEALGRLAGGVAHDFNNILTVIAASSDLLLARLAHDDPTHTVIQEIREAGQRAASLTRRLLVFSRQQKLRPEIVNINALVRDAESILRRVVGDSVTLTTGLEEGIGSVRVDPGQIDQIIMNLAVNARDAMPQGGILVIGTQSIDIDEESAQTSAGVAPGSYVMLTVSDTGHGMDAATQERIFEPFFTTKGPGLGTGLGLATVYGIVKQSGGSIRVQSVPNRGTTFTIYLPLISASRATEQSN